MTAILEHPRTTSRVTRTTSHGQISIVGIGVRLPQADDPDTLWDLIRSGATTFREVSRKQSLRAGYRLSQVDDPGFVPVTSSLRHPDCFDAAFFGIADHEARTMDPQHRVLLQTVWSALEDAGHAGDYTSQRVGLFASVTPSTYLAGPLTRAGSWDPSDPNYGVLLGNDKDFAATRTAYALGLTGPCLTIQTACSSSLVAVHVAKQSLESGECDLAIVAGSSISLPHLGGYLHRSGSIFSASGVCRPFDEAADGTVKGNGAVAVVLRRAQDALRDGDRAYARILGSAVSNDGRDKAGFAAPGIGGQSAAIAAALRDAGLDPDAITYLETHGTGTQIGDPLEVRSLLRAHRDASTPCRLGSLKATMGHLDAAAGVAGLAKAALVARHSTLPPMAGFTHPNPMLGLQNTRFEVSDLASPVTDVTAGVSSFGMGGTNAHVILRSVRDDERPDASASARHDRVELVVFGHTARAAGLNRDNLVARLERHPEVDLHELAATLRLGRRRDRYQITVPAASIPEALERLRRMDPTKSETDAEAHGGIRPVGRRIDLPLSWLEPRRYWVLEDPLESRTLDGETVSDLPPGLATISSAADCDVPEMADLVARQMGELLGRPLLDPDEDFFGAGADSLLAIDLVATLQDEFGIRVDFPDVEAGRTPATLAQRLCSNSDPFPPTPVRGSTQPVPERPVEGVTVRLAGASSGRNLFLVHPAGGTTACYLDLAGRIAERSTVWGLNFPMSLREKSPSLRELAGIYVEAIREIQPDGPYLLGGYSFGGNLAVEMALQLEAMGETVERLVLVDAHPPHAYTGGLCGQQDYVDAFPDLLSAVLGADIELESTGPWASAEQVIAAIRSPELTSGVRTQLRDFFDVWCANHAALKRWFPDKSVNIPTVVLEASESEPPEVLERLSIRATLAREWRSYVSGPCEVIPIEGDHYSIFRNPSALTTMAKVFSHVEP